MTGEPDLIQEEVIEGLDEAPGDLMATPPDVDWSRDGLPDENKLQDDNEFILSVMKEYRSREKGDTSFNQSIIYKPLPPSSTTIPLNPGDDGDNKLGKSCQTSFDMYLNKTISTEPLLDSDAPLSTIPSDRSDQPHPQNNKTMSKADEELLLRRLTERRASSSAGSSGITPRSCGVTPLSVDTVGITPRSQLQTGFDRLDGLPPVNVSRSFSSSSKYRETASSKRSSKQTLASSAKYGSSSANNISTLKFGSSGMSSYDSQPPTSNNSGSNIKDLLNYVDELIEERDASISHSFEPRPNSRTKSTPTSPSRTLTLPMKPSNSLPSSPSRHRPQYSLSQSSKKSSNDRSSSPSRRRPLHDNLSAATHKPVDNRPSSEFPSEEENLRDQFIETDVFLTDLLSESKKIKALAEQIFNEVNCENNDFNSYRQSQNEEERSRTEPVVDLKKPFSSKSKLQDQEHLEKQQQYMRTQCSCQCDICKSNSGESTPPERKLTLPRVVPERVSSDATTVVVASPMLLPCEPTVKQPEPKTEEPVTPNNYFFDCTETPEREEIFYCCTREGADLNQQQQQDQKNMDTCISQTRMQLPVPPSVQKQDQLSSTRDASVSCNRLVSGGAMNISFNKQCSNRNVYREVEFLRERCSDLVQKLRVSLVYFYQIFRLASTRIFHKKKNPAGARR